MISCDIKQKKNKITGLDKLFKVFPRNFSLEGAYLKGVLLHENGDIQLTYSIYEIDVSKTYIFVFIFSSCQGEYTLQVPTVKTSIIGIDIFFNDSIQSLLRFIDKTNNVDIVCQKMEVITHVILSKAYAKEQAISLTEKYSDILQKKFEGLKQLNPLNSGKALFRRDDSYNGIFAKHHTMYKLDDLHNKDNSIVYEFLIEFDKNDPCLGIYYGCKGLIKKGDNLEQQKIMMDEWNSYIRDKVLDRLNKTFPEKKFNNRFKPTDNANDNTFWPFWISLQEDENLLEVAVRATIIIRDEYKRYLEGDDYNPDEISKYALKSVDIDEYTENHSITRFTLESWEHLNHPWEDKQAPIQKRKYQQAIDREWANLLEKFVVGAIREGYLTDNVDRYEKAFLFKGSATYFSVMLELLVNRMRYRQKVRWELICKQFLDKDGKDYSEDVLKNSLARYIKSKYKDYKKIKNEDCDTRKKWEEKSKDDIVVRFKKIMN